MGKGLLVIDLQNDYFPGGAFPLWNPEAALEAAEAAIRKAHARSLPVILVQHLADPAQGPAPFFNEGSQGAALHPRILAAAPEAPVVVKRFADAFDETSLESCLGGLGVRELLICGMMTQNCVTHTALSRAAASLDVTVLADACATVSDPLHRIALHALSRRVRVRSSGEIF